MEGPLKRLLSMAEMVKAMKPGKAARPSEVCEKMTADSGKTGTSVMLQLCQCVLDGKGMPHGKQVC